MLQPDTLDAAIAKHSPPEGTPPGADDVSIDELYEVADPDEKQMLANLMAELGMTMPNWVPPTNLTQNTPPEPGIEQVPPPQAA